MANKRDSELSAPTAVALTDKVAVLCAVDTGISATGWKLFGATWQQIKNLIGSGATAGTTQTITSSATITPLVTDDVIEVSALTIATTIENPTGTAAIGQGFVISIKDDGTARAITWGSGYAGMDGAPVATTTAGKLMDIPVRYSSVLSKWLVYKPSVQA